MLFNTTKKWDIKAPKDSAGTQLCTHMGEELIWNDCKLWYSNSAAFQKGENMSAKEIIDFQEFREGDSGQAEQRQLYDDVMVNADWQLDGARVTKETAFGLVCKGFSS